ncbi:group III truncated hemoglobin [Polaribacter sp. WD7]|uniref:group III truncated hemoglobin n=1 Tax=Polaribacter sp. WD7 TaxID=2269061 RepID=UPI000DF263B1|nr:group III truncated hemoglobin [Polaribacter sp. WD7]RCS27678.1 group III truncated hemoglobin [Polaribacter sp. WD7]
MRVDISSREDIKFIITKFYNELLGDPKMFPFFKNIVADNHLQSHIEVITNFWSDILLDTAVYSNNVMKKHLDQNAFTRFKKQHFTIWISYLFATIDNYFEGQKCNLMKNRATSIATVMQLKMNVYEN